MKNVCWLRSVMNMGLFGLLSLVIIVFLSLVMVLSRVVCLCLIWFGWNMIIFVLCCLVGFVICNCVVCCFLVLVLVV